MENKKASFAGEMSARWIKSGPYFTAGLRIVSAVTFVLAGTIKLFAFPVGMPPNGATAVFMTEIWIGGVLEVVGGTMMVLGWYTRPVAFILCGEMAVAYFQFHAPAGFWPVVNNGVSAMLYCFIWLYFSAAGSDVLSIDGVLEKRRTVYKTL